MSSTATAAAQPPDQIGYLALLRRNKAFRQLWYGQIVSQLGDWFDSIALFALLFNLTGSGQAVGGLLVAQFLPSTLISPFAGVVIDRLPRKFVLIAADVLRGLLVLLFLLVDGPEDVWIVFVVTILKYGLTAFFEPARSAITPSVTRPEELVAANAISGVTWSAMLALGAAIGGLVVGSLGIRTAFLIDAASFGLSALLIAPVMVNEQRDRSAAATSGVQQLRDGVRYLIGQRDVALFALTKALWSIGGGVLLLLTLFGREIFPWGKEGAYSIGLLYAARGIGAGIGPLLAQRLGGSGTTFLRRALGPSIILSGLGYLAASGAPSLPLAMLAVVVAHMGGSTQWVFSTVLIQQRAPSAILGRIFAVEYAALMLTTAASSYGLGVLDDAGWSPRTLAVIVAIAFFLPGLLLTALLRTSDK